MKISNLINFVKYLLANAMVFDYSSYKLSNIYFNVLKNSHYDILVYKTPGSD
jgi:hypothetical protein